MATLPLGQKSVGPHFLADAQVRGLLFDCDGTLLDSMPLFLQSWLDVCPRFGLEMTEDLFYGFAGLALPEIVRRLHRSQKGAEATDEFVKAFLDAKHANHVANEHKQGHPAPIACVVSLAREAVARGIPIAMATSGVRQVVEGHLEANGLSDLFSARRGNLVVAADVAHGKPAPDIFVEAARRIGVDPRECRAYEDGESGLIAAHAAGCHVVDVTYMHDYPSCTGLRRAKEEAARTRTWHLAPAGASGSGGLGGWRRRAALAALAGLAVGAGVVLAASRARARQ